MTAADPAIYIEITATRGSTPRDRGTVMRVTAHDTEGTIGGGALEYQAIATARRLLDEGTGEMTQTLPLGPSLGQCCGGAVTLRFTRQERHPDPIPFPAHRIIPRSLQPETLWLWGAGHVGRAVVDACPPQAFRITWVDSSSDRFPPRVGPHVTKVPASDMPILSARAPTYARHLIFTYSHDIDLALCAALLKRGFASCGLIGSDTKWARFQKRLTAMGLDPTPIQCPIGDKSLGKAPHQIAAGTARALLELPRQRARA